MMSEQRFGRITIVALIGLILAGVMFANMQQSAWSEGYMMGLIAGGGEGDALSQYVLYNSGRQSGIGGFFGGLFKLGFVLLGLLFVGKMVRMIAWHRHYDRQGDWPGRGPWSHGPKGEEPATQRDAGEQVANA